MSKPRRGYRSPEAVKAALKRKYEHIWRECVEVANPPTTLYHYCPEDTLPKILESCNLWASDVLRMNDPDEITYAFGDVIGPVAEAREDGLPKYFIKSVASSETVRAVWGTFCAHIACLSSASELPSQWKCYAKCRGYAIGFDRSALERWCIGQGISLLPVSYDLSCHQKTIEQFLEEERGIELSREISGPSQARDSLRAKAIIYLASVLS